MLSVAVPITEHRSYAHMCGSLSSSTYLCNIGGAVLRIVSGLEIAYLINDSIDPNIKPLLVSEAVGESVEA
jgi:hypothetical protein